MSSLTCRNMGLGNFSDKDSLRHTPNREHCPWLPCRSHVPNWKLLCLWCIEGQRTGRASLSRRKSLRNFPGSCQQSRCSRLLWHYIYQKSKWVNCSLRNSLVDESQTVIKLFGCCAWSCHAYRHVRTLTRRCGYIAGYRLEPRKVKVFAPRVLMPRPAGHGLDMLAYLKKGPSTPAVRADTRATLNFPNKKARNTSF